MKQHVRSSVLKAIGGKLRNHREESESDSGDELGRRRINTLAALKNKLRRRRCEEDEDERRQRWRLPFTNKNKGRMRYKVRAASVHMQSPESDYSATAANTPRTRRPRSLVTGMPLEIEGWSLEKRELNRLQTRRTTRLISQRDTHPAVTLLDASQRLNHTRRQDSFVFKDEIALRSRSARAREQNASGRHSVYDTNLLRSRRERLRSERKDESALLWEARRSDESELKARHWRAQETPTFFEDNVVSYTRHIANRRIETGCRTPLQSRHYDDGLRSKNFDNASRVGKAVVQSVHRYQESLAGRESSRYDSLPQHPLLTKRGTPLNLTRFINSDIWPGETRFKRIRPLATAIHGEVSLYKDNSTGRQVVVKQLNNSAMKARAPGDLENALVEIGAMTYLFSPRALAPVDLVARLEGVFRDEYFTYMVSEFCSGGELFQEVHNRKRFRENSCKAIALQVALALDSLHENGICHRDVSLENTLFADDRTIRLIDFGQAETIYDLEGRSKLLTGTAGKAYYRAPEMLTGPYYGPPVDVFALGVMIFIMAIGSPPWAKASRQDPRYRNLTRSQTALDLALRKWAKRQEVSDALVDLLANIFCSNPLTRPTIREILCHPWFCFAHKVWSWIDTRGISITIRAHARRVEEYLLTHPHGNCFEDKAALADEIENDDDDDDEDDDDDSCVTSPSGSACL